jgi:predicted lipoprotein with Yx(FWY)xxD motif
MIRRKPLSLPALLAAAAVALVALAIAGCGGGGDQATAASAGSSPSTTIGVTDVSGLGKILVDSQGRTAYLFEKDTGTKSMCSGACAREWPPVTTSGKPSAGDGVTASMVGTTKRSDGTMQVTYNDHPLYRFTADNNPGDTSGQNVDAFGAAWHALSPTGDKVQGNAKGSGGGYAY